MRVIGYLVIGIMFGIVMFKSEAASWFRIYEMFRFESFHMYGIIGSALVIGVLGTLLIKKKGMKDVQGEPITFQPKEKSFSRYMYGGIIFGLGWALAGACPGPIYTLIGAGYVAVIVVFLAAMLGTFVYGLLRDKLLH
ncbi:YeeE/YedE family protein [Christiangramia sp. LLG6405-1]|uniref:YeeE/YedE family protein n=1 Tax=Christiangramia sp. LLG6405-1 TaxID=3160832 RepID=UPI003868D560